MSLFVTRESLEGQKTLLSTGQLFPNQHQMAGLTRKASGAEVCGSYLHSRSHYNCCDLQQLQCFAKSALLLFNASGQAGGDFII